MNDDGWTWSWFTPYGNGPARNEFTDDVAAMRAAEIDSGRPWGELLTAWSKPRGTVSDTKRAAWSGNFT